MINARRFCTSLLAGASALAGAAEIELTVDPFDIAVDRGSSADVVFTITNMTSSQSRALSLQSTIFPASGYTYALVDSPGCGPLIEGPGALGTGTLALTIDPVPASGMRSCTLRLSRSATAIDSTFLFWSLEVPNVSLSLRAGMFADVSLTAEVVSREVLASGVHTVFKVRATNHGAIAVVPKVEIEECQQNVAVDQDMPGACPVEPGSCGVAPSYDPVHIVFAPIAPAQTGECLVGLSVGSFDRTNPLAVVTSLMTDASTGGLVDYSGTDGQVVLDATLPPVALDQYGLSGSWANPETPGQGIVMSVQPNVYGDGQALVFGGWFTYDAFGSGDPRWYTLQGLLEGDVSTVPIYLTRNGRLDSSQPTLTTLAGSATIRFADCTHGEIAYSIAETSSTQPRTGTVPLTRLLSNIGCTPAGAIAAPPPGYAMSGIWADGGTQGQGLVVDVDTTQDVLFAAWYTYTAQGDVSGVDGQRWYTLQAGVTPGATEAAGIGIYESRDGRFNGDRPVSTVPVGTAHFVLHSCLSATLDYAFTTGDNAGLRGSLQLGRLGDAPPGCML